MPTPYVAIYLNDHLAGATAALELLGYLEKGHPSEPPGNLFADLRAEIDSDRGQLQALMERVTIGVSTPRKAMGWLAEKITELKLGLDDPAGGALRLFESLEGLSLGIEGKKALWQALATAAETNPELRGPDYAALGRRADQQRCRVEALRLNAARAVLGGSG